MAGRGEYIRLLFAEAATPYEDPVARLAWAEAQKVCYGDTQRFAVPALEDRALTDPHTNQPITFSQTPVILQYLAEHLDGGRMLPGTEALRVRAGVLNQDVADATLESCNAWHAVHPNKDWKEQKEGTQPHVDFFLHERLPKWLKHFNRALQRNVEAYELVEEVYFVGSALTYADLVVFNLLNGIRNGRSPLGPSGPVYEELASPLLKRFVLQIISRPRVKAWYQSPLRHDYGDGSPAF